MPILQNTRHEAFAQLRARGAPLDLAYAQAGYEADSGHGSRLAKRPAVAARIAELRARRDAADAGGPPNLINALREARAALMEARGLIVALETQARGAPIHENGGD
jgi:uncharacterized protein YqfA (UPF0365 family)